MNIISSSAGGIRYPEWVSIHSARVCSLSDYKQEVAGWVLTAGLQEESIRHRPPLATDLLVRFPPLVQLDTLWFHVHAALMCSYRGQNVTFGHFWFPANRSVSNNLKGNRLMGGSEHFCRHRIAGTLLATSSPMLSLTSASSASIVIYQLLQYNLYSNSNARLISSVSVPWRLQCSWTPQYKPVLQNQQHTMLMIWQTLLSLMLEERSKS